MIRANKKAMVLPIGGSNSLARERELERTGIKICQDHSYIVKSHFIKPLVVNLSLLYINKITARSVILNYYFWSEHPNFIGSVNNLWREPIALCQLDWVIMVAEKTYNGYETIDLFLLSVRQS